MSLNPDDLVGQDLSDRLRLGELRGTGTYGWTYEGDLLSLGRSIGHCAIKICQAGSGHDAEAILKEMRDWSRLLHPRLLLMQSAGVVRVGAAAGYLYVTSELADLSLQDVLDRGELLGPDEMQTLLEHICEALDYMHAQGLAHGDVRPANILRSAAGGWKLGGIEFRQPLGGRLEELGPTEHLFVYRAPELFEAAAGSDGPPVSCDLWALAVVAHAGLTGRLPFAETPGLTRGDMIWRIINRDPEPEELPDPIHQMVRSCLRKSPEDRWTAAEALACLQGRRDVGRLAPAVQEVLPVEEDLPEPLPVAPPLPLPLPQPAPRRPVWLAVAVAVMAAGLIGGLLTSKPPPKHRANVLDGDLLPVSYEVVRLDSRGRLTSTSAEVSGLMEEVGGSTLELIQVPTGDFLMGTPAEEPRREADESPLHVVHLDTYLMGRFEVTQSQWAAVAAMPRFNNVDLKAYPSKTFDPQLPVDSISYDEAQEFCDRLTQQTGRIHRLPTEAEWEYACRGGSQTAFGFGPTLSTEVANFRGSRPYVEGSPLGPDRLASVSESKFPGANAFGLCNMHGNVWEWCQDFYGPYSAASAVNPTGPAEGYSRVLRGGGFRSYAWNCRSGARSQANAEQRRSDVGFRVVMPKEIEETP